MSVERQSFYEPHRIVKAVEEKIEELRLRGKGVDHLTFVPDGEPMLDASLGRTIELLRKLQIKIAVITNSSLIWEKEVRQELALADWVSVKIDSLQPNTWKKINRPYGRLSLERIADGMIEFARMFKGESATQTMLVGGLNDQVEEIDKISTFILKLKPKISYLSVPTRPPAESWAGPPS
jgi:wyosine [tRNA(Phe)-imidazoG37] synthetase (radical SAM superfamily)